MPGPRSAGHKKLLRRVATVLKRHFHRFFSFQGKVVQGDDIEAIHDMRVASRRFQEVVTLTALLSGVDKADLDGLREVRQVRRALGRVRDLDVMIDRLQRRRADLPDPSQADALDQVIQCLQASRAKALRKMRGRLGQVNLPSLYSRLEDTLSGRLMPALEARLKANGGEAGPEALEAVARTTADRVAAREAQFLAACHEAGDTRADAHLHQARIAGKKLRYLLEAADQLRLGAFKPQIKRLKAIQETLGDWHDLMVLEEHLLDICCDRQFVRQHLPTATFIHGLLLEGQTQRQKLVARFVAQFRRQQRRPIPAAPPQPATSVAGPPPSTVPPEGERQPCGERPAGGGSG